MDVQIRDVAQQYLAAVRENTTGRNLAITIRKLLDENAVYRFLKEAGIEQHGRNTFVYWDDDTGLNIEVGVQVFAPFTGSDRVICTSTPPGRAAMLVHVGPYDQLGRTHDAIIAWCRENQQTMTGLRWEVYGRWNDDPAKLTTEVFYLLK